MNGMKLGGPQKGKNSFAFDNEFLNYGNEEDADSQELPDDDDEDASDSYGKKSYKANLSI